MRIICSSLTPSFLLGFHSRGSESFQGTGYALYSCCNQAVKTLQWLRTTEMCLTDLEEARGPKSSEHPQSHSPAEAFKEKCLPVLLLASGGPVFLGFQSNPLPSACISDHIQMNPFA